MNVYAVAILLGLLFSYAVHTVSDALNVRSLRVPPPESIASLYGADGLVRSTRYAKTSTTEAVLERSGTLAVLLAFWLAGGFEWLDLLVRQWFSADLIRSMVFLGMLALGRGIIDAPFDAYRTFVIEARFGFNRTTFGTFVRDRAKAVVLFALLSGGLLVGLLLLFQHAGAFAWLICWLVVVAFTLVVQWLGPVLILPLFNRFMPMPEGELRDSILEYARSVDFPLDNVFVIDGSRRSSRANAYFTGLGRKRRIALFDTLIDQHSEKEIVAVLAHEVGHYRLKHVTKGIVAAAIHSGVALFLLSLLLPQPGLYEGLLVSNASLHAGFVAFGLLFTPVETLLSLLANLVSRRHEFAADRFAVDTAPSAESLADALKALSVVNLTHPNPHGFHVALNYSHPPLAQRLEAISHHLTGHAACSGGAEA